MMAEWVRLFGRLWLQHRVGRKVELLRVRVQATVPGGAKVQVADVQCQSGSFITGWTLHSRDLGVGPVDGWALRNGIVRGPAVLVVGADVAFASPLRIDAEPLNGASPVTVGSYLLGNTAAPARVDGFAHTATQGAGLPPHLTARADCDIPLDQPATARTRLMVWLRGIIAAEDPEVSLPSEPAEPPYTPDPEPDPDDPDDTPDPDDPEPPDPPDEEGTS